MAQPFIGEIRMGGWNFAPRGYALCNGALQSIANNNALFALIGTTYGGDGVNTFGLPDLQGRSVVHRGTLAGTPYTIGDRFGVETVTLTTNQLPSHTHVAASVAGPAVPGPSTSPANKLPNGQANQADPPYGTGPANTPMSGAAITQTGGSQPHNNLQPLLAITFVIAVEGVFPARN